jgi:hypothetical protein
VGLERDKIGTKREGIRVWIEEPELDSHLGYSKGIFGLIKPLKVGA